MPGTTLEATCGEHGVAHRGRDAEALAERGRGPLDDRLGGGELELGAPVRDQVAQLLGRAAVGVDARGCCGRWVVAAVMALAPVEGRTQAEHLQGEGAQAGPAFPRSRALRLVRTEVLVAAVGAVEGTRALAHEGPEPAPSPRSRSSSARATQAANDSPSSRSARKLVTTVVM